MYACKVDFGFGMNQSGSVTPHARRYRLRSDIES